MSTTDRITALRNPSPEALRAAASQKNATWLPVFACAGDMLADAMDLADKHARGLIARYCVCIKEGDVLWFDTWAVSAEDKELIQQAVRYLEARGLLARIDGQPHLVTLERVA